VEIGYGPECHLRDVNGMARWACSVCDYEYNEEAGDPAAGIPPGTRFEDLPAGWRCPGCRVGKEAFVRVDEEEEVERSQLPPACAGGLQRGSPGDRDDAI